MDYKPNREEFKAAIRSKNPFALLKQGCKAAKILYLKKALMVKAIKTLKTDYVLSTRLEFAQMLTDHAPKGIVTMTQEHLHDGSDKYIARAQKAFAGLDYLLVLCDGSRENFTRWLQDTLDSKVKVFLAENPNRADPQYFGGHPGRNCCSRSQSAGVCRTVASGKKL